MDLINTKDFREKILDINDNYKSDIPTVVDFSAEWCGPCKAIAPVLNKLSIDYKDKVNFYKVDVDEEFELVEKYGIKSIPTLFFISKNGEIKKEIGNTPKNKIQENIEKIL